MQKSTKLGVMVWNPVVLKITDYYFSQNNRFRQTPVFKISSFSDFMSFTNPFFAILHKICHTSWNANVKNTLKKFYFTIDHRLLLRFFPV